MSPTFSAQSGICMWCPSWCGILTVLSGGATIPDRKSTRLNSSHLVISYAVFCLKKKNRLEAADHDKVRLTPLADTAAPIWRAEVPVRSRLFNRRDCKQRRAERNRLFFF